MLGVGVESTHLPAVVLDRGRRLELFLADMKSRGGVQERINLAFMKAFKSGIFKRRCEWTQTSFTKRKFVGRVG